MRKLSCLHFLMVASFFASATQPQIASLYFGNSERVEYETPTFCAIRHHSNSLSRVSNPVPYSVRNGQNPESGMSSVIRVYPNPAKNQVNIFFPAKHFSEQVHISLQNLSGQVIKQAVLRSSPATISLTGLTPGIYIYSIGDQAELFKTGKLIIQ